MNYSIGSVGEYFTYRLEEYGFSTDEATEIVEEYGNDAEDKLLMREKVEDVTPVVRKYAWKLVEFVAAEWIALQSPSHPAKRYFPSNRVQGGVCDVQS